MGCDGWLWLPGVYEPPASRFAAVPSPGHPRALASLVRAPLRFAKGAGLAGGFDVGLAVGGDGDFGYGGVFGDAVCADYGSGFFD